MHPLAISYSYSYRSVTCTQQQTAQLKNGTRNTCIGYCSKAIGKFTVYNKQQGNKMCVSLQLTCTTYKQRQLPVKRLKHIYE